MPLALNCAVEVVLGFILLKQWLRKTQGTCWCCPTPYAQLHMLPGLQGICSSLAW